MASTHTICTSFKVALLDGEMDFSSDTTQTFKIALYTSSATLGAATTAYTTSNEVSGTGYTAGGNTLTIAPTRHHQELRRFWISVMLLGPRHQSLRGLL